MEHCQTNNQTNYFRPIMVKASILLCMEVMCYILSILGQEFGESKSSYTYCSKTKQKIFNVYCFSVVNVYTVLFGGD